ncbi:unnamed protein product [Amoebophrya sp. A120]|nr:unnamed protein product [Amoebophrya sp. A120]|eukprot:GSA120T00015023001.1
MSSAQQKWRRKPNNGPARRRKPKRRHYLSWGSCQRISTSWSLASVGHDLWNMVTSAVQAIQTMTSKLAEFFGKLLTWVFPPETDDSEKSGSSAAVVIRSVVDAVAPAGTLESLAKSVLRTFAGDMARSLGLSDVVDNIVDVVDSMPLNVGKIMLSIAQDFMNEVAGQVYRGVREGLTITESTEQSNLDEAQQKFADEKKRERQGKGDNENDKQRKKRQGSKKKETASTKPRARGPGGVPVKQQSAAGCSARDGETNEHAACVFVKDSKDTICTSLLDNFYENVIGVAWGTIRDSINQFLLSLGTMILHFVESNFFQGWEIPGGEALVKVYLVETIDEEGLKPVAHALKEHVEETGQEFCDKMFKGLGAGEMLQSLLVQLMVASGDSKIRDAILKTSKSEAEKEDAAKKAEAEAEEEQLAAVVGTCAAKIAHQPAALADGMVDSFVKSLGVHVAGFAHSVYSDVMDVLGDELYELITMAVEKLGVQLIPGIGRIYFILEPLFYFMSAALARFIANALAAAEEQAEAPEKAMATYIAKQVKGLLVNSETGRLREEVKGIVMTMAKIGAEILLGKKLSLSTKLSLSFLSTNDNNENARSLLPGPAPAPAASLVTNFDDGPATADYSGFGGGNATIASAFPVVLDFRARHTGRRSRISVAGASAAINFRGEPLSALQVSSEPVLLELGSAVPDRWVPTSLAQVHDSQAPGEDSQTSDWKEGMEGLRGKNRLNEAIAKFMNETELQEFGGRITNRISETIRSEVQGALEAVVRDAGGAPLAFVESFLGAGVAFFSATMADTISTMCVADAKAAGIESPKMLTAVQQHVTHKLEEFAEQAKDMLEEKAKELLFSFVNKIINKLNPGDDVGPDYAGMLKQAIGALVQNIRDLIDKYKGKFQEDRVDKEKGKGLEVLHDEEKASLSSSSFLDYSRQEDGEAAPSVGSGIIRAGNAYGEAVGDDPSFTDERAGHYGLAAQSSTFVQGGGEPHGRATNGATPVGPAAAAARLRLMVDALAETAEDAADEAPAQQGHHEEEEAAGAPSTFANVGALPADTPPDRDRYDVTAIPATRVRMQMNVVADGSTVEEGQLSSHTQQEPDDAAAQTSRVDEFPPAPRGELEGQ